jgi:1,4-alpha-glucan branching enzyme
VRHPELPYPLEEDWLFEALTETYVPLVMMMDELAAEGVDFRLTLTLSPPLLSMLEDPLLVGRYEAHLDRTIALAEREVVRTRREAPELASLAREYQREFERVRHVFRRTYGSRLARAFRAHWEAGRLEVLASAATHAFLPLLDPIPQAIRAQVQIGVDTTKRVLGRRPRGFWLPECAYHPGHESYLKDAGIQFSFLEAHGVTHAHPRPTRGVLAPIVSKGGVVFFGRDHETSRQVWSAESGYPGDPFYREFYKDIGFELPMEDLRESLRDGLRRNLGIKYHRVTGKVGLGGKQLYDRTAAFARTAVHAGDFVEHRRRQAREAPPGDRPPIVVSPYDAELFGHWWYEGPQFLAHVFRLLAKQDDIAVVTPAEYLERHPECEVAQPPFSTWGAKGYADVWLNPSNDWIYPHLDMAAERMVELAQHHDDAQGLVRRALDQAARELMLAQSSDWPFIMTTGTAVDYAKRRVRDHVARFTYLYEGLVAGKLDEEVVRDFEERDNLFPALDYRVYG